MNSQNYDVIIIGSNINGFATASLLAKRGFSVCLIPHPHETVVAGGQVRFQPPPPVFYCWDYSRGALGYVLDILGLRGKLAFHPPEYIDKIISPSLAIERVFGWEAFQAMMLELFPKDREPLAFYFQEMSGLGEEWRRILQAESIYAVSSPVPKTLKYRNLSYADFVNRRFTSPDIQAILLANQPRTGVTLPVMAGYLVTQVFDYHSVPGGYGAVCAVLRETFCRLGGTYLDDPGVNPIRIKPGEYIRVEGEDREPLQAKCLVSTLDEATTIRKYLAEYHPNPPDNHKQLDPVAPFSVILKVNDGFAFQSLTAGHALYYFPDNDISHLLAGIEQGHHPVTPVRAYPDPDRRQVVLQTDLAARSFPASGDRYAMISDWMIQAIHRFIPIHGFIESQELYTPDRIETGLGYESGFVSRWAFRANEITSNPFDQKPLVSGIYNTGQWGGAWFTSAIAISRAAARYLNAWER